ncbi:amidohydrolase family protein [Pseudobacter ginsenosidimutans]|uniref:Cytosine/adenosine deaminase-related metal-dependent hydrolase n=1 Tax=Pseudobacter ginsenosidimutans TaxID=661488 RepID=A0A4Q7N5B0_9BACT|nr:amidohydrolase family protein [Pseudobacter ginsenosidimutans]QEC44699.1 amidohydrolase family protein [Pseudobacter ginsenosidimutans]RZS76180.1 cytosine/adenosine deaminase-related metal-dependent hydrolase [Pseudobacter ginsenosidimutans]
MDQHNISRKHFIRNASALVAGGTGVMLGGNVMAGESSRESSAIPDQKNYSLKNVKLETGFEYEEGEVIATKTELFLIKIADGKIAAILPNDPKAKAIDAKGMLMLPAFRDMHIHLDKTFYGGPWKARQKKNRSVRDMISLEQRIIPELLKTSTYRAEKLVELLQSNGSDFARSHVNIDPTSGLNSLKNLQLALQNKKDSFGAELVAFPQHGLYYTDSTGLMREAAKMDIDFIGGLDPQSIDGDIQRSINFTVDLAMEFNKGIDIHLHEGGESGLKTVEYLIERVKANPQLKGKTFLSHCFVLARLDKAKQESIADSLAGAGIGIVSTIPFGNTIMPIPALYKYDVTVLTGNDSIIDHWNTFGSGSVLQKANLMAQLYGYSTEFDLSRSLKLATANVLPLDDKGNRQWPATGDKANLVLVDASCSAEAVSRISPVRSLIHEGKIVFTR